MYETIKLFRHFLRMIFETPNFQMKMHIFIVWISSISLSYNFLQNEPQPLQTRMHKVDVRRKPCNRNPPPRVKIL